MDQKENVADDPRLGRPRATKSDEIAENFGKINRENRRHRVRAVTELAEVRKETVR